MENPLEKNGAGKGAEWHNTQSCGLRNTKASEKGKMKDTMERAKLKSELDNMQRLVDRIPPEVLAELKRQQRHTKER